MPRLSDQGGGAILLKGASIHTCRLQITYIQPTTGAKKPPSPSARKALLAMWYVTSVRTLRTEENLFNYLFFCFFFLRTFGWRMNKQGR